MDRDTVYNLRRMAEIATLELARVAEGRHDPRECRDAMLNVTFLATGVIDALRGQDSFVGFEAYEAVRKAVVEA